MPTMCSSGMPHVSFSHDLTLFIWSAGARRVGGRPGGARGRCRKPRHMPCPERGARDVMPCQALATLAALPLHPAGASQPQAANQPAPHHPPRPALPWLTLLLVCEWGVQAHVVARVQRNLVPLPPQLLHQVAVRLGAILDGEPAGGLAGQAGAGGCRLAGCRLAGCRLAAKARAWCRSACAPGQAGR